MYSTCSGVHYPLHYKTVEMLTLSTVTRKERNFYLMTHSAHFIYGLYGINPRTHCTMSERSYHGATYSKVKFVFFNDATGTH